MDKIPPPPKSLTIDSETNMKTSFNQKHQFGYRSNNRLDQQLMELRKEMAGLRQLDMSLLSQLNVLRESILEFKSILNGNDSNVSPVKPDVADEEEITDDERDNDTEPTTSSESTV